MDTKMEDLLKLITDEDIEKYIQDEFGSTASAFYEVTVQNIRKHLYRNAPILLLKYHLEELTVHQYAELCRAHEALG